MYKLDLVGKTFGMLTILSKAAPPSHLKTQKASYWLCQCQCEKQIIALGSNITCGKTRSCGCQEGAPLKDKESAIKSSAKEVFRNNRYKDGDLTFDDFYSLSQLPCYYCGGEPKNITNIFTSRGKKNKSVSQFALDNGNFIYNGLDRIDNNFGHNKNNVVPCCRICNCYKTNCTIEFFMTKIANLKNEIIPITIDKIQITQTIDEFVKIYPERRKQRTNGDNGQNQLLSKINWLKSAAKRKDWIFNLTQEQCVVLISSKCTYCDWEPDMNARQYCGADRLDSNFGYLPNNCVSACKYCNIGKNDLTLDEFRQWIRRIKYFQGIL